MIRRIRSHALLLGALGAAACNSDTQPAELHPGSAGASSAATGPLTPGAVDPAGANADGSRNGTAESVTPVALAGGGAAGSAGAVVDAGRVPTPGLDAARDALAPPAPGSGVVDPGSAGDGDFIIDTFTTQPELTDRGAPRGQSFSFSMDSTRSAIFDGSDATLQPAKPRLLTRNIAVYVPAQYTDGTPAPLLVIQDGPAQGQGNAQVDAVNRALDNLTISSDPARKIPAFISVAVQNGGNDGQGSERGLEYDTMSDRYARFIQLEVLPAVLANAQIRAAYPGLAITEDPEGKAALGCSSGAAAAFSMAWFRPDLFRRVITYSGTFVAQQTNGQPESAAYPLGAWEYHSSRAIIANTDPPQPIRTFLNVNGMDNGYTAPEDGHHNWVLANQHMAAALKAKNYHYRFVTAAGIGHCDGRAWQSTLADTLVWVWAGYPTN